MAEHAATGHAYTYRYPRPAVTVDAIMIKLPVPEPGAAAADSKGAADPTLLLIERGGTPFAGCWALPGGFVDASEDLAAAAIRELEEETGAKRSMMTQVGSYGAPGRDPRGHTITVAYAATLTEEVRVEGADDATKAAWVAVGSLPRLGFDHSVVVRDALRVVARALLPGSEPYLLKDQLSLIPAAFASDSALRSTWAESLEAAATKLHETQPWSPAKASE